MNREVSRSAIPYKLLPMLNSRRNRRGRHIDTSSCRSPRWGDDDAKLDGAMVALQHQRPGARLVAI